MARKAAKKARAKPATKRRVKARRVKTVPRPPVQSWAVRELEGPVPGPASVAQRKSLIDAAIDAVSVGPRRGKRSTMWRHFGRDVIYECMVRIVVGGEPAQAVARHVCGVDDPATDIEQETRAKRLQELLSTLRRVYHHKYEQRRQDVELAGAIDACGGDLSDIVNQLQLKLAVNLNRQLDPAHFDELSASEKHLLIRSLGSVTEAMEKKAKAGKDEAATERVKKQTEAESGAASGGGVDPTDQGIALELITGGIIPTAEAIATRKREKAARASGGAA